MCNSTTNILASIIQIVSGAILGASFGFYFSKWGLRKTRRDKEKFYKDYFNDYVGQYSIKLKDKDSLSDMEVEVIHEGGNSLKVKFSIKNKGEAIGYITIDKENLKTGSGFYSHTQEDLKHLSGFYEVMLIEKGLIHARQNYIKGEDGVEVVLFYIWTRK